jgi:trehalose 6-phosphate phosphatase
MRNDFLAPARRPLLERLAGSRLLLAFDYDGVLAPLVRAPEGTAMRPRTRQLLVEVARRYPVAVISGRARADLARRVAVPGIVLVGNHGFELGRPAQVSPAAAGRIARWEQEIAARLDGVPGWRIEHKVSTLSIHYGLRRDWRSVGKRVAAAGAALRGARLVPGKRVLNVLPASFPDKGDAVARLLARRRLDVALFLGDDVTDEDVFALGEPRVVGVRVGPGRTGARWRLAGRRDVDALLARLAELREPRREKGVRA